MPNLRTTRPSQPTVAIFDSGLGGLSIYDAIRRHFPWVQLAYCSDSAAFPYGTKAENELVERVSRVLTVLHKKLSPDILVIACNTASTVALPKIRSLIREPVIGVVPAIKPAASIAGGTHIGLLATPGTVQRNYTRDLIQQFGSGFEWVLVGSSELVMLAERKMYGEPPAQEAIANAVTPLRSYSPAMLDTVVLGCTHFPLLLPELRCALPNIRHWVDSSDAIAKRCGFWLHELGHQEQGGDKADEHTLLFTGQAASEKPLDLLMRSQGFRQMLWLDA